MEEKEEIQLCEMDLYYLKVMRIYKRKKFTEWHTPSIMKKFDANGSSLPLFMTDDEKTFFVIGSLIQNGFSLEKQIKESSGKIVELIRKKPGLTIRNISIEFRITTLAVEKQIHSLKKSVNLKQKGSRKTVFWEVIE